MSFLGLGNYAKPGKGVKKDAPRKKRFFQFFELYFRKFGKLIELNLIYVLFCIPIVTIGPATAAMTKVVKCYVEEKPVFLFSDFWSAFKENFKQGLVVGLIDIALTVLLVIAFYFYYVRIGANMLYFIPLCIICLLAAMTILANFYVYLLMVSVNLKFFALVKDAMMLGILGLKSNIFTIIFGGIVLIPSLLFFPLTVPVLLLLTFSTVTMITVFNSFQYIYRYVIHPYYYQNGLEDPYEEKEEDESETIFTDMT